MKSPSIWLYFLCNKWLVSNNDLVIKAVSHELIRLPAITGEGESNICSHSLPNTRLLTDYTPPHSPSLAIAHHTLTQAAHSSGS